MSLGYVLLKFGHTLIFYLPCLDLNAGRFAAPTPSSIHCLDNLQAELSITPATVTDLSFTLFNMEPRIYGTRLDSVALFSSHKAIWRGHENAVRV